MRTFTRFAAALLATVSVTAAAHADEPPTATANVAPAAGATAADPNVDRGFVLPTAMTQPAGSLTYNNYELLLHGVTYGVTDNFQLSATVLAPIVKDVPFVGLAAAKLRVLRTEHFHLALQGSAGVVTKSGENDSTTFLGSAGLLASACLREDCSSLLSASVAYEHVAASGSDLGGNGVLYGASLVHRVGDHVKLLGEVASGNSLDTPGSTSALVGYGVRFFSNNLAADIGFLKPVGGDGSDPFILGLPFASVSYRWL